MIKSEFPSSDGTCRLPPEIVPIDKDKLPDEISRILKDLDSKLDIVRKMQQTIGVSIGIV